MKLSLGLSPRDYSVAGGAVAYDTDAQAYFTANTSITSSADKNAINTFYLGLKSDGIYTKIKAMYLPIWGSASASKWNLVNPLDTDAAFRMSYSTGWTFSSGGALPNGTSAYAIPYLIVKTVCSDTSHSFGIYSRTNDTSGVRLYGCWRENAAASLYLQSNLTTANAVSGGIETIASYTPSSTLGLINVSRTANNSLKVYRNGSIIATNTTAQTYTLPNAGITFGGRYKDNDATIDFFDNHQFSFAYISNGLTDTEVSNLSNRVNTLMAYFGINTYPVVSDADAQAYINANDAITNQSDANAINTFFTGLKSDGIYTKIKAMYLPIWGSAASSKWNLVNPLDTNGAFRLNFSTGITYSSSGITFNGTSAYADTFLLPSTQLSLNSSHISLYTRTNTTGIWAGTDTTRRFWITPNFNNVSGYNEINTGAPDPGQTFTRSTLTSHWISSRTASITTKLFNKTNLIATNTLVSRALDTSSIYLGARNVNNIADNFSGIQLSFSSIGTGLTDAEATNLYNRVQTLMTYFGINV